MAISNRAAIYNKIYRVTKKHFKPVPSVPDRSVLDHVLYSCCLENAHFNRADEAHNKIKQSFYDWNEVRVTTVNELSEVMSALLDPTAAAARLKHSLQSIFESCYSFDLESLRKQNIGKAVKLLVKYGATPFSVAYVTQHALAGHSIPKDSGVLQVLQIVGAITPAEAERGDAPGLERTIPKKKGIEFASLLHQLGADFTKSPYSPAVRAILLEIDPAAKQRMPKRQTKKKVAAQKESRTSKSKKKKPAKTKQLNPKTPLKKTKKKTSTGANKTRSATAKKKVSGRRISKRKPK